MSPHRVSVIPDYESGDFVALDDDAPTYEQQEPAKPEPSRTPQLVKSAALFMLACVCIFTFFAGPFGWPICALGIVGCVLGGRAGWLLID